MVCTLKATFTRAKVIVDGEDAYLCLSIPYQTARKFVGEMVPSKEYDIEIKLHREKRSLDANAYYWALCGQLACAMGEPPETVYRRHIRDIGNYETLCVQRKALESFIRTWSSGHLGRFVETRESKLQGCVTALAYYGSSDFNRAQMAQLIDNCIQDCKVVGIETLTEREKSLLLEAWK